MMNNIAELIGSYLYSSGERIHQLMKRARIQTKINRLISFELILLACSLYSKERKIIKLDKRLTAIEEHNKAEKE